MLQRCYSTFCSTDLKIPRSFLSAKWDRRGHQGYYHFCNNGQASVGLFRDIAKTLKLNSLHFHLVEGQLIVTFTRRQPGTLGEQTVHFYYGVAGSSLRFVR